MKKLFIYTLAIWIASCGYEKDLQIRREYYQLLSIDTVYREERKLALLAWKDSEKMVWKEFLDFPVFEKVGQYYVIRVRRNFFK